MSGTYPGILEKTFQEESIHIHRRFIPFRRTYLAASALLQPIRGILIQLRGPTPRIRSNLGSCIIQLMRVFADVPFEEKNIYQKPPHKTREKLSLTIPQASRIGPQVFGL
jgi:hypothetical protein